MITKGGKEATSKGGKGVKSNDINWVYVTGLCHYVIVYANRYERFQLFNKVIPKGCPQEGVRRQKEYLETDLSPETSAYQNSTHLHHFKKRISPNGVKIKKL